MVYIANIICAPLKVSLRIMNHSYCQTNSNQPYAIILYVRAKSSVALTPYHVTKEIKPKRNNIKIQN